MRISTFPAAGTSLLALAFLIGIGLPVSTIVPGTADAVTAEPARSTLRVVTFNLFHGGPTSGLWGDDRALERRLEMVIRELRELDPDIVTLQEASTGRGRGNVPARVASALGYAHVFAPATTRVFREPVLGRLASWIMNFAEGSAIVSRFPITSSASHDLPRCVKRLDPRVVLQAQIQTPWGPLHVLTTHISNDPCQLRRAGELARAARGPLPTLLSGDLNHVEGSAAVGELRDAGLVDAFRVANPQDPGLTVWQRVDAAAPTVFRRVDYVLLVPGTEAPGRVVSSRVVLNTPARAPDGAVLWPSDHYGVLVEIDVSR